MDWGLALQDEDRAAGSRLRDAVLEAYGKPGRVRNPNQLSKASGIARTTLDGYLTGTQPTAVNMRKMAAALGVPAESLWLRWLGYEVPEPGLTRIAHEIEALRRVISAAGGDAEQLRVARVAIDAAQEDPPGEPAEDPPAGPASSVPRHKPVGGTRR